jgi:hypothetical protein
MQTRPNPRLWLIVPNLEHASGGLAFATNPPPDNERAR